MIDILHDAKRRGFQKLSLMPNTLEVHVSTQAGPTNRSSFGSYARSTRCHGLPDQNNAQAALIAKLKAELQAKSKRLDRVSEQYGDLAHEHHLQSLELQNSVPKAHLRVLVERARELAMLKQLVEETILVAKKDDDGEWVTAYHFQTGAIHRLLAAIRSNNYPAHIRQQHPEKV